LENMRLGRTDGSRPTPHNVYVSDSSWTSDFPRDRVFVAVRRTTRLVFRNTYHPVSVKTTRYRIAKSLGVSSRSQSVSCGSSEGNSRLLGSRLSIRCRYHSYGDNWRRSKVLPRRAIGSVHLM
jgi:hypothetical protein